jgi:hypothetical protein
LQKDFEVGLEREIMLYDLNLGVEGVENHFEEASTKWCIQVFNNILCIEKPLFEGFHVQGC